MGLCDWLTYKLIWEECPPRKDESHRSGIAHCELRRGHSGEHVERVSTTMRLPADETWRAQFGRMDDLMLNGRSTVDIEPIGFLGAYPASTNPDTDPTPCPSTQRVGNDCRQ